LNDRLIEKVINNADLFVIAGSGYLHFNAGSLDNRVVDELSYIENISCPVVMYGIGVNIFLNAKRGSASK